jgi:hypothetical protein
MAGHAREVYVYREGTEVRAVNRLGEEAFVGLVRDLHRAELRQSRFFYTYLFGQRPVEEQPSQRALYTLAHEITKGTHFSPTFCQIPAGYTYLGQFIFHDITHFALSEVENGTDDRKESEDRPYSKTSPAFDLESVLGSDLGHAHPCGAGYAGRPLAIGWTLSPRPLAEDVPRVLTGACSGFPLIADERNDDFLPLAQIHLLFLKFFNGVAARHGYGRGDYDAAGARRDFLRHAQWVVLHDYLLKIVDECVYDDVIVRGRACISPGRSKPHGFEIPIEFAAAAARFGHCMVRPSYHPWNDAGHAGSVYNFMHNSYRNRTEYRPFCGLTNDWTTNWLRLFAFNEKGTDEIVVPNEHLPAAAIRPALSPALWELPGTINGRTGGPDTFNLAAATLDRQRSLKLASAEQCIACINAVLGARAITPLEPEELAEGLTPKAQALFAPGGELRGRTPIWFYVVQEAAKAGGSRLGPFGSRLIMETMHAALASAPDSIVCDEDWRPTLPASERGTFSMSDLIVFTGDPNPLGRNGP